MTIKCESGQETMSDNLYSAKHTHEPDITPGIAPDGHCRVCRILIALDAARTELAAKDEQATNSLSSWLLAEGEYTKRIAALESQLATARRESFIGGYRSAIGHAANLCEDADRFNDFHDIATAIRALQAEPPAQGKEG